MGLRDRLRRALARFEEQGIRIPLEGGAYASFSPAEMEQAFLIGLRLSRGEPGVEPHPANVAAANSPDPRWRESFWAQTRPKFVVEDLSEGGRGS